MRDAQENRNQERANGTDCMYLIIYSLHTYTVGSSFHTTSGISRNQILSGIKICHL